MAPRWYRDIFPGGDGMSMKGKPNTAHFKLPKDPTVFLEGGEAEKPENPMAVPSAMTLEPAASPSVAEEAPSHRRGRVQKIFNFPEYLADRLRDEALLRSPEKGSRVTEKDIVVEALEKFIYHN
jgi:hypothetical protein